MNVQFSVNSGPRNQADGAAFAPIVSISGGQNEQFQIRYKNNSYFIDLENCAPQIQSLLIDHHPFHYMCFSYL